MTQPLVIVVLAVLGLLVLVVGWVALTTARVLRETRAEVAELRARLARTEAQPRLAGPRAEVTQSGPDVAPVLITGWGDEDDVLVPDRVAPVDGRLFADTVLRETVVKAAGLGHGVRRALAPEVRDRIRLEMRREVRRARKQRKTDLKAARRAWEADARRRMAGDAEDDAA